MASTALATAPSADKTPPTRAFNSELERLFQQLTNVATLPQVAQDILAVAQDPNSGVIDLLPAVEQDPSLAANVVKTANSSFYAPRQPIGDLQTALSMLGMDQARNLALTVVVGERFTAPSPIGEIDRRRLWDHSVCTAAAARTLASHTGLADPEEAYLSGLIHDLGLLVIDQHFVEQLPRLLVRFRTGEEWVDAEQDIFSFDHAQLGAYIAWRSGFPDQVVEAVDLHHESNRASGDVAYLVSVVSIANYLVTRMGRGSIADRRLTAPSQTVFDRLELDRPALREVWAAIEEQLDHVGELLYSVG